MLGFFISKKQQNSTLIEQKIKQNILDISNIKSLGENLIFNTSYSLLYEENIRNFLIILFKKQLNKFMHISLNEKKEIEGNINHDLLLVDVDLLQCQNCSFVIQKVDDDWFTINMGDKNCGEITNYVIISLPRYFYLWY